jgi:hypothetical protein
MSDPESKEPSSSSDPQFDLDAVFSEEGPSVPKPAGESSPPETDNKNTPETAPTSSESAPQENQSSESSSPPVTPPATPPDSPQASADDDEIAGSEIPRLADIEIAPPPKRFLGLKTIELAGLGGVALLILILILGFRSTLVSQIPIATKSEISRVPKTPVKGNLLGIAEIDSHWRPPAPGERVKSKQAVIPELRIRLLDPSKIASNGFIRVIIRDDKGKIRGDVNTQQVINGTFGDSGSNEIFVAGTEGFEREMDLSGYGMGGERNWSAELLEGPSYAGDTWESLVHFTISHRRKDTTGQ